LHLSGASELPLEDGRPLLFLAFRLLGSRHGSQFPSSLGDARLPRLGEEDVRRDQGRVVPRLRRTEGEGEGAKDATGALEALEARPFAVEHVGEVWVEGVAADVTILGARTRLAGVLIESRDALDRRHGVPLETLPVLEALRREEASAQDLGDVLLKDRLHPFLLLAPEDGVHLARQLAAEFIALAGVCCQQ